MDRTMLLFLGVVLSCGYRTLAQQAPFLRECHATDNKPYIYFATKTPYELINKEDSSPLFTSGCRPILFWLVGRHGTRYPPGQDVRYMKERLPKLRKMILQNHKERRGTLCQQDVENLANNGSLRIDENFDEALTATGREELLLLGRRFRSRFADFFATTYSKEAYQFRHLANPSSQASARSFARGLFPDTDVLLTEALLGDPLIQFYYNCTPWTRTVDEKEESNRELQLFQESQVFQNTLSDVTTRLGFQYNMSSDDMLLMYDICRYQKAWNLEQISSWCAAFSTENLKVLEYAEDLKTYYKQGYGFPLNYEQACPLIGDLVTRMRVIVENGTDKQERGVFYFTELEGILRFVARLGIARDSRPLTYRSAEMQERKWRTSLLGSFASNVALVFYNCTDGFKIHVFAKEEIVHLDQCQTSLCTLEEFMKVFQPIADQCAMKDFCNPNSASVMAISYFVLLFTFSNILLYAFQ